MIADLKPYAEYKESGLPWLGQVPTHWDALAIRRFSRVFAGATPSRAIPAYWHNGSIPWLASGDVNLRRIRHARQFITEAGFANSSTKWIRPGSLVVALAGQGRTKGMVATVEFQTTCNQSLAAIEPDGRVSDYRFVAYWLESRYLDLRALVGDGLRDGLNLEHIRSTYTPVPPPDEQAAIVRFLDWANGRLERAIRAKRKVIALLNEQKQAIIHRAVTRGLDPSVLLKPSGIPWLGDIPQHWEVRALKRVVATKITDGPHETPELIDDGVDFMSAESMVNGRLVFERRRGFISRELHEQYCLKCRPQRHDVFMCKSGATTGKVAIVETDREFSVWSPLALLRANTEVMLPRFLFVSLQTKYVLQQVQERWSFGTQPNLAMGAMGRISIAVPTLPEQEEALRQIEEESAPLTAAISRLEREIELLREYRTRLVADVVTGKLDVREAAARLPDEAPLDTADDDADLTDETETETESADGEAAV